MPDRFTYDVFLSHNSRDKPRVRALAEELRAAGLQVWFDEWVIKPGDDIYLAVERGLEAARAQVLCLSPAALGSEWVTLERSTVLFRDPTNAGRRFIPLLLVDCNLPDALRRYKYVDYRQETKTAFDELLAALLSEKEAEPEPETEPSKNSAQAPEQTSHPVGIEGQLTPHENRANKVDVNRVRRMSNFKLLVFTVVGAIVIAISIITIANVLGVRDHRRVSELPVKTQRGVRDQVKASNPTVKTKPPVAEIMRPASPEVKSSPVSFQDLMNYFYQEGHTDIQRDDFLGRHLGSRVIWNGWIGGVFDDREKGISVLITAEEDSTDHVAFLSFPQGDRLQLTPLSFRQKIRVSCRFVGFDARAHLKDCELIKVWPEKKKLDKSREVLPTQSPTTDG